MMKYFSLYLCSLFFCLAFTFVAAGQNKDVPTTAAVISSYDEKKGLTTVEFRAHGISSTKTEWVLLTVSETFKGKKAEKLPDGVSFILSIGSIKENRFPDVGRMDITADGKKLGQAPVITTSRLKLGSEDKRNNLETIATVLPYAIFKKMSQAKSIKLELPDLMLELDQTLTVKLFEVDKLLQPTNALPRHES